MQRVGLNYCIRCMIRFVLTHILGKQPELIKFQGGNRIILANSNCKCLEINIK